MAAEAQGAAVPMPVSDEETPGNVPGELHTAREVLDGISTASKVGKLDQVGVADCNQRMVPGGAAVCERTSPVEPPEESGLVKSKLGLASEALRNACIKGTEAPALNGRKLGVHILTAEHLPKMDITGAADPYVKISVGKRECCTTTKKNTLKPEWDEHFVFDIDSNSEYLVLTVMDWDRFKADDLIGECRIRIAEIAETTGTPFPLPILEPGSRTNVVGTDHCNARVWLSTTVSAHSATKGSKNGCTQPHAAVSEQQAPQPTPDVQPQAAETASASKAERWAARAAEMQQANSQAAAEFCPHAAAPVGGPGKAARWAARARQAQGTPEQTLSERQASQPAPEMQPAAANPAGASKAARWAARAAERQQENSQAAPVREAYPPQTSTESQPHAHAAAPVGGPGKAARWAARARQAQGIPVQTSSEGQASQPAPEMQPTAANPAGASKAARWAARAAASAVQASPAVQAPHMNQALSCVEMGHQGSVQWPAPHKPASGSAMEYWMVRAEAKKLHLPWDDKFRDYADEVYLSVKAGLTEAEIVSRRRHMNPPEHQRIYSSILETKASKPLSGLGWARSCLDSQAAWRPSADDFGQWMEIDLLEEIEIFGLVTQGQAATGCGGSVGVCERRCPPPHQCKGGGEVNFAVAVDVQYRTELTKPFKTVPRNLEIAESHETSREKRRETLFPFPVRARYVRIVATKSKNSIALRAGVIVENRDRLFESSPFALNGVCHRAHLNAVARASSSLASNASAGNALAAGTSKASRWAARAAEHASHAAPAPAETRPQQPAGGKAARWAARAAGSSSGVHTQTPPPQAAQDAAPAPPTTPLRSETATGDSKMRANDDEPTTLNEKPAQEHAPVNNSTVRSYVSFSTPKLQYSGWVLDGQPHDTGRLRMSDGTEYHGALQKGNPHGSGTYYFPDSSRLKITFKDGCPEGKGLLRDRGGQLWDVVYDGKLPLHEGAVPSSKVETYPPPFEEVTIDLIAVGAKSKEREYDPIIPPRGQVTGKLVFARPMFADIPLWNREECRNAIVVVARGPYTPDYEVSFGLKIHHAQMAGAKAVVIIDGVSPFLDCSAAPTVKNGLVESGIKPHPPETEIRMEIPAVVILGEKAHLLQETAIHMLSYLDPTQCSGLPSPEVARVGYLHRPKQESKVGMEKSKAEALMAEFFAERRKERTEETSMLMDGKSSNKDQAEESLKSREFYGGNFFESMNPFKDTKGTENFDQRVRKGMMLKMSSMPVVGELQKSITEKMEVLRQDIEAALPVTVSWHEHTVSEESAPDKEKSVGSSYSIASLKQVTGFQMPTLLPKDPKGNFVWCATGQPPFWLLLRVSKTTAPFNLIFTGHESAYQTDKVAIMMNSCADGKVVQESLEGNKMPAQVYEVLTGDGISQNCERNLQKNITVVISVNIFGYHVTVRNESDLKNRVWFLPHNLPLETISLDRLSTLPLDAYDGSGLPQGRGRPAGCAYTPPRVWRLPPADGLYKPPPKPLFQWRIEDWELVFRHTALDADGHPFEYSPDNDWAQAKRLNVNDPDARNFSILGDLEDFRCSDGKFTMMLRWPDDAPNDANIWRQSSNPVTMDEAGVYDYTPVRIDFEESGFRGLQKTDHRVKPHANSFIDGCDHHEAWFYSIGTSGLWNKKIPGPNGFAATSVELWVTTKDVGIKDEPEIRTGNTDPDNPVCEHGKLKAANDCSGCKEPLAGYLVPDHNPYIPCMPGHGTRWIWDLSERGQGHLTLNSKRYFGDLEASADRAVKNFKFPLLYNLEYEQTACSGYYNLRLHDRLLFSGWLSNGLPDGMCSVRWLDGSEYHGEFLDGEMTGYGRYIFPDTSEYRGQFQNALPQRGMFYPPQQQQEMRRLFDHSILGAREPLWNLGSNLSLYENMPENPLPRFVFGKADCLAAVKSIQGLGAEHNSFDHITTVTARLVWARPIYADQPLWNASECRGKIVVCMRGPRPPAPPCNYSIKLFHCQNAGAAGVIFVDFDSFQKFTIVPRVEDGPIYEGGPVLKVRIPCMLTLTCYLGVLQEGALHTMTLASNVPSYVPPGWKIGFVICRRQEHRRLMSKAEENSLMTEFFKERRQEREEENELLQDRLEDMRQGVDSTLGDKEFVGGGLLDSLNFAKQDEKYAAPKVKSGSIAQAMLSKVTDEKKAKELADQADVAAQMLGGLFQGALGTMTGEAAAVEVVRTARSFTPSRQRAKDDGDTGRNRGTSVPDKRRSRSQPRERRGNQGEPDRKSNGQMDVSVPRRVQIVNTDDNKDQNEQIKVTAEQLREERAKLLARVKRLEIENKRLREQADGTQGSTSFSMFASASSPSSFLPSGSVSSLFAAWSPSPAKAPQSPEARNARGPAKTARASKPEWL